MVHVGSTPTRSTGYNCDILISMSSKKKTNCTRCAVLLTDSNRSAGRALCKPCNALRMKQYYMANPDIYNKHKGYVAKNDAMWKARVNSYIYEVIKESNGCVDCGERNMVVLDFDHRDPNTKSFSISGAHKSKVSWDMLVEEINKCDIVCANCHRIRTAKMFGNWRLDFDSGM